MSDRTLVLRDLEYEVGVMLHRIRRVIAERAHVIHPELTPAGYLIAAHLAQRGPRRPSALVDAFVLDKGSVSRHVQQLVDLGLATKERDPADGRAWIITATPDTARRVEALSTMRRERLDSMLADWDEDDMRGFVSALARYNATLG